VQLVGDDLFVTTPPACSGQSERWYRQFDPASGEHRLSYRNPAKRSTWLARAGYHQRESATASGETRNTTIADLAVTTRAVQTRPDSLSRTPRERVAIITTVLASKTTGAPNYAL